MTPQIFQATEGPELSSSKKSTQHKWRLAMPIMNKEDREKYSDLYYWLMYDLPDLPDSKPKVCPEWTSPVATSSVDL